jgi:hypothetical protein
MENETNWPKEISSYFKDEFLFIQDESKENFYFIKDLQKDKIIGRIGFGFLNTLKYFANDFIKSNNER